MIFPRFLNPPSFQKKKRLATPVAMDQLGYSDDEAVKKVGIVLSIGCILTVISFALSGPLARRSAPPQINYRQKAILAFCGIYDIKCKLMLLLHFRITERKTLILFGLVPLLLCHVVLLPYSGPTPRMQQQLSMNILF